MYTLPKRRTLVHKAIEPRKLSAKVQAALAERNDDLFEVKYDGCLVILIKSEGKGYAFSRQGEPVLAAMDHVLRDLERIPADNFALFAEAWHPLLDHSTINGTFRRQYVADGAELLEAVVFDYVPLADFEAGACPVRFKTRRDAATAIVLAAQGLYESFEESPLRVSYISQTVDQCQHFVNHSRDNYNEEFVIDGFMRKDRDGLWKAGSGSGGESVKLKDHMSIDVKVLAVLEGKGKFVDMVGSIQVLWGMRELVVGGGKLTDKERKLYWDFPSKIVGRIVEVHGLSESQHGMIREPRFIRFRDDKTEGE